MKELKTTTAMIIIISQNALNEFKTIIEDKNTFIEGLLKTHDYYYSANKMFFLKNGKLEYYCESNAKNSYIKTHFYDLVKKEHYSFQGLESYLKYMEITYIVPSFLLLTEEGKTYVRDYKKQKNSTDFISFKFDYGCYVFKKGTPNCFYAEDYGFDRSLYDFNLKKKFYIPGNFEEATLIELDDRDDNYETKDFKPELIGLDVYSESNRVFYFINKSMEVVYFYNKENKSLYNVNDKIKTNYDYQEEKESPFPSLEFVNNLDDATKEFFKKVFNQYQGRNYFKIKTIENNWTLYFKKGVKTCLLLEGENCCTDFVNKLTFYINFDTEETTNLESVKVKVDGYIVNNRIMYIIK